MWAERMRQEWQHTSTICSYLIEVNKAKKTGRSVQPNDLNPMEGSISQTGGIPLNSEMGFKALEAVAKQWRPRR